MKKLFFTLIIVTLLGGCSEIKTSNPYKVYKYWSGSNPPENLHLMKGQYWQSAHWTREYIMFLKFKTTNKRWDKFVKQNHLEIHTTDWLKPNDFPTWFQPSSQSIRYKRKDGFDQGSRYFSDKSKDTYYIYEIQL